MRLDDLILELQDMVNNAKSMPLSKDTKLISGNRVFDILEELQDCLPNEIRQAKGIVADREQILAKAEAKAEDIIHQAEERRKIMVSQSEIVRAAEAQAKEVLMTAKKKSDEMHKAANDYVDGLMTRADESMSQLAVEIKETRKNFKASAK